MIVRFTNRTEQYRTEGDILSQSSVLIIPKLCAPADLKWNYLKVVKEFCLVHHYEIIK